MNQKYLKKNEDTLLERAADQERIRAETERQAAEDRARKHEVTLAKQKNASAWLEQADMKLIKQ